MQKLKEILSHNILLKLLSLVLAFLIYLVVVNVSNPEITGTKTVQVEVENENVLTAAGKTFEFTNGSTVIVSYTVRTRDAYKIASSDFRAYIDMNTIYDLTGAVPVSVEIVNNKDLFTSTPTTKPTSLRVTLEDIVRKVIPVNAYTEGTAAAGYTVMGIETNPTSITVKGPESLIQDISYAEITVDVEGANGGISGNGNLTVFDNNGHVVEPDERLIFSRSTVDYTVTVLAGKDVPVTFSVSGQPADGYAYAGISSSINQVTILGNREVLDGIASIAVPGEAINVNGAQADISTVVDISEYLPSGTIAASDTNANITVSINGVIERTIQIPFSEVIKNGMSENYNYSTGPGAIQVVVAGLKENLDTVTRESLGASVDFTGLEVGLHEVQPTFTIPDNIAFKSATSLTVTISEKDPLAEGETEADGTVKPGPAKPGESEGTEKAETKEVGTEETETEEASGDEE